MDTVTDSIGAVKKYISDEFGFESDEVDEMAELFVESMNDLLAEAESQIAESALDKLQATGHSIKGSALNVGAKNIAELGIRLEGAGKENNIDACHEIISELKRTLGELT